MGAGCFLGRIRDDPHPSCASCLRQGIQTCERRPAVKLKSRKDWPAALAQQCAMVGLPTPTAEWRFHSARRWRWDLAWIAELLAVEVDGGIHSGGRHTRGKGWEGDVRKIEAGRALGWQVIRVSPGMVRSGEALQFVERALKEGSK